MQLPVAAEDLVPHRLPMRLVDTLTEVNTDDGVATACIRQDNPMLSADGTLEEVALIEIMAQSYAALKGYVDKKAGLPVRRGFLTGVKDFHSHAAVRAGDELRITIETIANLDHFAVAQGHAYCGEVLVAQAEIKIWVE
ncbi:MAG: hypothetical protein RBR06_06900 [Desulfuromonadaceae bacterium]|nr:hypothetical protein [Desulfuromonas sp.]MDY0212717.1 hypothetical protein [Desulfuromonadaceae bacterium]